MRWRSSFVFVGRRIRRPSGFSVPTKKSAGVLVGIIWSAAGWGMSPKRIYKLSTTYACIVKELVRSPMRELRELRECDFL
jgi:hypothetical protein